MLYFLRDHHRRSESACRVTRSWPRPENQKRRKAATQERYQLFQTLYDKTTKLNRIGRLLFEHDPVTAALFESKWPGAREAEEKAEEESL